MALDPSGKAIEIFGTSSIDFSSIMENVGKHSDERDEPSPRMHIKSENYERIKELKVMILK